MATPDPTLDALRHDMRRSLDDMAAFTLERSIHLVEVAQRVGADPADVLRNVLALHQEMRPQ